MSCQIRKLSYALGAEIIGIDITAPLDSGTVSAIHAAFLDYCVLLFRGQRITTEQQLAFTRNFGKSEIQDALLRNEGPSKRDVLMNKAPGYRSQVWHSDRSFTCVPTMATLLRGVEMPSVGGDTMFSNLYLAYETLSDGMRKLIEGLEGIHPGSKGRIDHSSPERLAETMRLNPPIAQPVVRIHPETSRKSLYLEEKVTQFVGMTVQESKPLIDYLLKHAARPQFIYRHRWRTDDLLMWDNRCTNHIAVADYDRSLIRHTEKTCVAGTPCGYPYFGSVEVSHY